VPEPGVVGRDVELSEVDRFLTACEAGVVALAIEGEAGIGKTTIWSAAVGAAEERGATVLWCHPSGSEAKFSFAGLGDLLAPVPDGAWESLARPQREALEVALLRAPPGDRRPIAHAVSAGFLALVRELARERPLLIAVDDLQWLDAPSRSAIEFAVRRLDSETVGVLYTRRIPSPLGGLERTLSTLNLRRLRLRSLSLAALAQIVAAELGVSLPRPLLVRISELAAGNPFYVLEIARLLGERGSEYSSGAELPLPDDLRLLTARRVRRLPAAARDELLLAAVLANPDATTVELARLAPAEEAGLVSVDGRGRVEFNHPLFASAAYGAVSSVARRRLHRRAAGLVGDTEQRARHLALAADQPDEELARRLDDAGVLARRRGATDAAAELAELAAAASPPQAPDRRIRRLLTAAHLHMDAGDLARAEALAQGVLSAPSGDLAQAEALRLMAQLRARHTGFSAAAALGSTALAKAGGEDRLAAEVELDLGFFLTSLGQFPQAVEHARAAVARAESSGDPALTGDALAGLSVIEFLAGGGLDAERIQRAVALDDPLRVRTFVMRPSVIQGMLQLWTGELERALDTLVKLQVESVTLGQEGAAPLLSLYLVWAGLWHGRFADAARWVEEALAACELLEDPMVQSTALSAAALLHAHTGGLDRAREQGQRAIAIFERLGWVTGVIWPCWALGLADLAAGRPAEAVAILGPAAEHLTATGDWDPVLGMFVPDEVEALIGTGELERAEFHLGAFEQLARRHRRGWALAAAARVRGSLAAARGNREAAFAAFDEALGHHARTAMPFERARTLMLAGQAHRRFKQRSRAAALLAEATDVFDRLGAEPWVARAREEHARIGRRSGASETLTAGERRVAELAAAGLSNREIAEQAFLSVKTVEATLSRTYRKLRVRSRVGLARALEAESRSS
jgi:DNA-binding CsgD family transcriptional regulator